MASDSAACRRMVEACRQEGVTLAVAYYRRGYASIQGLRQWLQGRKLDAGEMTINDTFPLSHRLDLVHFLAGNITKASLIDEHIPHYPDRQGEVIVLETESGLTVRLGIR